MQFAIFGATGQTGRHLVEQVLAEGHAVTALARDPARVGREHERLRIVQGDVCDLDCVRAVVAGTDGVLSTLGQTRPVTPHLLRDAAQHLVRALQEADVPRLVYLTGAGVWLESDQRTLSRTLIRSLMQVVARHILEDAQAAAEVIRQSALDWTVVRVPRLRDGPQTGTWRTDLRKPAGVFIARADVAAFMLREAQERRFVHQAPFVTG